MLRLDREAFGEAAEVADGLWILATRHHGGGFSRLPEWNNRAFVVRVPDGLVVLNGTRPALSFDAIRGLESAVGSAVICVASSGGAHHGFLGDWHDAFPSARIVIGARVSRTRNGQRLMGLDRVQLFDGLPECDGVLDVLSFDGLLGPAEYASPTDGGGDSLWATLQAFRQMASPSDPYEELWVHHRATGTVIGGENLAPYVSAEAHARLGFMLRMGMKKDRVQIGGRKVGDRDRVAAHWATIRGWGGRTLLSYHDVLGCGFVGDVAAALGAATA